MAIENPYKIDMERTLIRYPYNFHMALKSEMIDYLALGLIEALIAQRFSYKSKSEPIRRELMSCILVGSDMNEAVQKKIDELQFRVVEFKRGMENPYSCKIRHGIKYGTVGSIWRSNIEELGITEPRITMVDYYFCMHFDDVELNGATDTFVEYLNIVPDQKTLPSAIEAKLNRAYQFWSEIIRDTMSHQASCEALQKTTCQMITSKSGCQIPVFPEISDFPNLYDVQRIYPDAIAYGSRINLTVDYCPQHVYVLSLVLNRDDSGKLIPKVNLPTAFTFAKGQMGIDFLPYDICGISEECYHVTFTTLEGMISFIEKEL